MQDVARLAGVSLITVSRVLRQPQRVAVATRERVQAAILETGYVPNLVAGSLKSARTDIVAFVIPSVEHSMVAEVVRGLGERLREDGLHLLMGESGFSLEEEEVLVAAFLARRPDAMLLMMTHTLGTRRMLDAAGIPVIEIGNLTDRPIDMVVGYSNLDAARTIGRAMIGTGRRKDRLHHACRSCRQRSQQRPPQRPPGRAGGGRPRRLPGALRRGGAELPRRCRGPRRPARAGPGHRRDLLSTTSWRWAPSTRRSGAGSRCLGGWA